MPDGLLGALCGLSQEVFEFGEGLLDGVEVWGVGGAEEQPRARGPDGLADCGGLVAPEVIEVRRNRK